MTWKHEFRFHQSLAVSCTASCNLSAKFPLMSEESASWRFLGGPKSSLPQAWNSLEISCGMLKMSQSFASPSSTESWLFWYMRCALRNHISSGNKGTMKASWRLLGQWQARLHYIWQFRENGLIGRELTAQVRFRAPAILSFVLFLDPIQSHKYEPLNSKLVHCFEQSRALNDNWSGFGATFSSISWKKFSAVRLFLPNCGLKMPETPRAVSFTPAGRSGNEVWLFI